MKTTIKVFLLFELSTPLINIFPNKKQDTRP
jgi:hypothetical protein